MSLAAKLPFRHPYAAGFPGLGSQPVPTDADALDYLDRMAAADGASVEVGVATAVSAFVRDSKALGVWDSIRASCILAGARTLAGALVPLRDYGPELVDIDNLPTPTINNFGGSDGQWVAAAREVRNLTTSSDNSYPRFLFSYGSIVAGKTYLVSGTLSGDKSAVRQIRMATSGASNDVPYTAATGVFSGNVTAGATGIQLIIDGTSGPSSVTIESLSIREVIASPTNVANGFVSGDYSRTSGLTGDGTSYLDSGRANDDDPQNDKHVAVYRTSSGSGARADFGAGVVNAGTFAHFTDSGGQEYFACVSNNYDAVTAADDVTGMLAASRSNASNYDAVAGVFSQQFTRASQSTFAVNVWIFARNNSGSPNSISNATLAFYSIGTSLSLEDLDTAVSNLINRLKFALLVGENPSGLDPDTIDYIVRGYEAGGSLE